jgi:hypothetical protein
MRTLPQVRHLSLVGVEERRPRWLGIVRQGGEMISTYLATYLYIFAPNYAPTHQSIHLWIDLSASAYRPFIILPILHSVKLRACLSVHPSSTI